MVYTQMFYIRLKQFKQEFNINDGCFMFYSGSIGLSIRFLIFFTIGLSKPFSEIKLDNMKNLGKYKLIYPFKGAMPLRSSCTKFTAVGVLILFSDYKEEMLKLNPSKFFSIKLLQEKGYTFHKEYHLLIPKNETVDLKENLFKQLADKGLNKKTFRQVKKKGALPLFKIRSNITHVLNKQLALFKLRGFTANPRLSVMHSLVFKQELYIAHKHPKIESYTYGFMNTLLHGFFFFTWKRFHSCT